MRPFLLTILLLAPAAACDGGDPPAEGGSRPVVVATLHPVASITAALAGGAASVRTLLPPGAHPDTYQATPRDARAMAGAELLVRVGGAADAWVEPPRGVTALVLAEGLELAGAAGTGTGNPHVWLDPVLVRDRFLPRIADALTAVAPDSAEGIRERAAAYADSLAALDAEIRALLGDTRDGRFVAAHPAWSYFADRYGLEQVGVLRESPGHEPGSRALARLVDMARERGVRAVMAEPQLGRAGVEAMARELGAAIEVADPVGGAGIEGREDYLSLMRYNARAFARALGRGGA